MNYIPSSLLNVKSRYWFVGVLSWNQQVIQTVGCRTELANKLFILSGWRCPWEGSSSGRIPK